MTCDSGTSSDASTARVFDDSSLEDEGAGKAIHYTVDHSLEADSGIAVEGSAFPEEMLNYGPRFRQSTKRFHHVRS